ncbi:hypothetical protein OS187_04680 [Xanthomonadaceae bacterium JHOS43]|nr:hypothetical protein [Xanthomonadaceae bacterium JHOS43]
MTTFNSDSEFAANLDAEQRRYFVRRIAILQKHLHQLAIELSFDEPTDSTPEIDSTASEPSSCARPRVFALKAGDAEYHCSTLPGSAWIKLSDSESTPICMWSGDEGNPWVLPLEGFAAFESSGRMPVVNQQLRFIARRRATQISRATLQPTQG